ncbi:dethiobiotin synthase [Tsukamurella pseudospumae]|uniref:ATP-dependent dethiobiotin synthetase BioD n=1 Tax=Tsukamurella pseudospumae TaxID=239498 RepID=A0A137ZTL5_9ACTN|nr:dethiobiotin synthase [Tsukamurella pseudospumae]KXP01520.1 dethiobiotin synthase [Tsukamurella pseudospumae]
MILGVTGTSTGVGKTVATAALAAALRTAGPVTVVKPAQTGLPDGADRDADGALSDAAEVARLVPGVETVEHRRYPEPLAPLTAARRAGLAPLGLDEAAEIVRRVEGTVLVEGAGGVLVRLGLDGTRTPFTLIDLARELGAAVVVVADPALGTLNHTELTVRALEAGGVACAGIVLSRWPEAPGLAERCNLVDLPELTGVPIVGRVPDGAPALAPARFGAQAASWFDREWLAGLARL